MLREKLLLLTKNKTALILLVICVVLMLIIFITSYFLTTNNTTNPNQNPNETKSEILVNDVPSGVAVSPKQGETGVSLLSSISAQFATPQAKKDRDAVAIKITPKISFTHQWTDNYTLMISPIGSLKNNTSYQVSLSLGEQDISWYFRTSTIENTSDSDKTELQTRGDTGVAEYSEKIEENYPWYNNLPVMEAKYFLYFNVDEKKFIVKVYTDNPQEVARVKSDVQRYIQTLGSDAGNYEIEYRATKK